MKQAATMLCVLSVLAGLTACASGGAGSASGSDSGWVTLINGSNGLNNFNRLGGDVWTAENGAIGASHSDSDSSFLVSENSYRDFELRVEFWASDDANSGVFIRCADPRNISSRSCYEVNIYDQRPDPAYGTGGIVRVAETPDPMPKAGGRWNTYVITARGNDLRVVLNGEVTVDVEDDTWRGGVFALQWGRGEIRFRRVEIRRL